MTFCEAVDSIERNIDKLQLRYKDGELIPSVVALGKMGANYGDRYIRIIDEMKTGLIPVDEYYFEIIKVIREYQIFLQEKEKKHLQ